MHSVGMGMGHSLRLLLPGSGSASGRCSPWASAIKVSATSSSNRPVPRSPLPGREDTTVERDTVMEVENPSQK